MASSLPSFFTLHSKFHLCRPKPPQYPTVRSQSFREEGKSANIVDDNLGVLKERIEEVRKKERVMMKNSSCCRSVKNGWNYHYSCYDERHKKRDGLVSECVELMGFASGALGLVFFSGSLCICLVSLIVHLSQN